MAKNSTTSVRNVLLACGIFILLGGCAQNSVRVPKATTAVDYPSEELRRSFGKIAVLPTYTSPQIELKDTVYDKGQCAKEMAGSAVSGMLDGCTDGMGCLGLLILSPVVAGVGAMAGAAEADTEEQVKARIELIHARTETSDIAHRFQEKGQDIAGQYEEFSIARAPVTESTDFEDVPFEQLRQQDIDTVLQVGITDIHSYTAEDVYCDPALALNIQTRLRLFSTDGKPVYMTSISRTSKARKLEDWAQRDAQNWDDALHEFVDDVTGRLLEDVFLHISPPAQLFQVPTASYADGSSETLTEKQPTFAWTWGPAETNGWRDEIVPPDTVVSYDLRVLGANSGLIHYEKFGLQEAEHKLQKKLRKKRFYSWQVRATFTWDGKVRRTPWIGDFPAIVRR